MEAPDEHRAFVNGFDGIPADMMIKFCGPLPDGTSCNLCQNVFPTLHRDPQGHYFCGSCVAMATTDNVFECPEDGQVSSSKMLTVNKSVSQKIWSQKLCCPNSPQDEPVKITFAALKAHLHECRCASVARKQGNVVPSPRLQPAATMPAVKKDEGADAVKYGLELHEKAVQETHEKNAATAAVKKDCQCPHCDEWFPKKEIKFHIKRKACSRKQQPSLSSTPLKPQNGGALQRSLPPATEMEWANSGLQFEPLNNPRDTLADGAAEHEELESSMQDQVVAMQERVSRLEDQVQVLSRQLEMVAGDLKEVLNKLGYPPES